MSVTLPGIVASKGIASGQVRILPHGRLEVLEYVLPAHLIEDEVARFEAAIATARQQLRAVLKQIPTDTPEEISAFIDTHLLMLEDTTLSSAPADLIRQHHCNAEWALKLQRDALVKVFEAMEDPYLRTRRDDVEHVVARIQHILLNADTSLPPGEGEEVEGPWVYVAYDLSPSDLMLLQHQNIAAIVTERGGPLSHTAILARSLRLPAVVGVHRGYRYLRDDETVVVDGNTGTVLADLDPAGLSHFRRRQRQQYGQLKKLRELKDKPARTLDGVDIELQANIELAEDISAMKRAGVASVGLYRTEFLYMNRAAPPDEEEQFQAYRRIVKRLAGAPLTIRTLDAGADKAVLPGSCDASNPALGLRAIRLCLKELDLFRTQLRAILRASAYGPVRILLPMITAIEEVRQAKQLLDEVKQELLARRKRFAAEVPVGAMIEVPAAALCADGFARELDFLSIGTNDLIQYTLATDRVDDSVSHLYNPLHPAVLRLLRTILQAGQKAGIPVSMCGEMAGDATLTRLLLGMGLRHFSMPPATILEVKAIITQSDIGQLQRRTGRLLTCHDEVEINAQLEKLNRS